MAATLVQIRGTLYDLTRRTTQQVLLQGEASVMGLEIGGGPITGGGGGPVDPGWGVTPPVDPGYGRPGGPVDPGYGRPGPGYPSTGPVRPGYAPIDPGYGIPEGVRPDNSLPIPPLGYPPPPPEYQDKCVVAVWNPQQQAWNAKAFDAARPSHPIAGPYPDQSLPGAQPQPTPH